MTSRSPFQPGDLVAAYLRDSGGEGQELSVPQQLDAFHKFCHANGLIPGMVFQDVARPGSSVIGRDGFRRMIDHFRHDAAEAGLVIWSYNRFARDFDDAQFYRADLRRRNYLFHSLNDDIPEGPLGKLYEAIIDWRNEQFLIDLSTDVKRGLSNLVQQYGAVPGTPPRGFVRQPIQIGSHRDGVPRIVHRWEPDPEYLPIIRQAYAMLLAGASLKDIQQETRLYRSVNSYLTFYTNPIYKGTLVFGDLVIENYCEPVIDPATWEAAQTMINSRAQRRHLTGDNPHHPRRSGRVYLLSGLLYCARCGSPMSGLTSQRPGRIPHERYACSRQKRRHDCDAKAIPRIFMDNLVLDALREHILTPENLSMRQDMLMQTESERQYELKQQRADITRQLAGIRRRIANITDALAEEGKSRALLGKLADLEQQEAACLSSLASLDQSPVFQPQSSSEIDDQVNRLADLLAGDNPRPILRGLISRISAERDGDIIRMQIQYFIPPEEHPPPETMSLSGGSLGALAQRHTFAYAVTVLFRRKKRAKDSNYPT